MLAPCPACLKDVSVNADRCPKCGEPFSEEINKKRRSGAALLLKLKLAGGLVFAALVVSCIAMTPSGGTKQGRECTDRATISGEFITSIYNSCMGY